MPNNPNAAANLKPFTGKNDPRNGRKPKGSVHLTTHIQELLEDENFEANILDPKIGIKEYKGRPIKAIVQVLTTKAINGDLKAADLIMKYGWAAKAEMDITSNGETVAQPIDADMVSQFLMMAKDQTKQ